MTSKLMFSLWAILLPMMVVDAANETTYEFTIAVFRTEGNDPSSKIANHFTQAVSKATGTNLKKIGEEVLNSPDSRFDFSQAVTTQSDATYILPNGTAMGMKLSYESDKNIVPLPFQSVVQSLGKMVKNDDRDVAGVAFIFEGNQGSPIYYFPFLSEKRRPIDEQSKAVFDYWTPDRIASAKSAEKEIAGRRSLFRKGRMLQAKIGDSPWSQGGVVQTAVGRLLFTFSGSNFMCTATAVTEMATDRTVIITAAHCAYDDKNKQFASNALFIPDQDSTTGTSTNFNCYDDPLGCWATSFAVVDKKWASQTWPDNVESDYAFYAVDNKGSHSGRMDIPSALDEAVTTLPVDFTGSAISQYTRGFGYPGNRDPDFRYCADTSILSDFNGYMMEACDLQASSSGGPWFHPFDSTSGSGTIISVNSYGYASQVPSGMGGPKLFGNSAKCLFDVALSYSLTAPDNGYIVDFSNGCHLLSSTSAPTDQPTDQPTTQPTQAPIVSPIAPTTAVPPLAPTEPPTNHPTNQPTDNPTNRPTQAPTDNPTDRPTQAPTKAPIMQCIKSKVNCNDTTNLCCKTEYCGSFVGVKLSENRSAGGKKKGTQQKKIQYNYSQCAPKKVRDAKCKENKECASGICSSKKKCT